MKRIRIGETIFYWKKANKTTDYGGSRYFYDGVNDITEAYKYPSGNKIDIGNSGVKELRNIGAFNIKAIRGSFFFFSIGAKINYEGVDYFIYITPNYNYIIKTTE